MAVICMENGGVFRILPRYGSVFEPDGSGGYVLRRGDALISQEEACAAANVGASGYTFQEEAPQVTKGALDDTLYYEVSLRDVNEQSWDRIFTVRVDAFDGGVIEVRYTK